jgi:predicted nucleotidyltransferase
MMKASGVNFSGTFNLSDYRGIILNEMKDKSLIELTKYDFEKAVDFCLLCVDKQRILKEENGRATLDIIMQKDNWEIQDMSLMEGIQNQYSFRTDAVNTLSDGGVGAV